MGESRGSLQLDSSWRYLTAQLGLIHTCIFLGMYYCVNFSVQVITKNGYIMSQGISSFESKSNSLPHDNNPLLNFSVHVIVDQIAGVNAPV